MHPSKPSEWIKEEARRLRNYLPRAEVGTHESMLSWETCKNQATSNFLDLLHSQGKIEMPDLECDCDLDREMTPGEAEIAKILDDFFDSKEE